VSAGVAAPGGLDPLLASAAGGDERAFEELARPHRRAIHLHCYRMLGSFHDADDALQETLLRAWRGLDRYEPRSPLPAWLQTIATNVCLTAIARRRRRRELPAGGALAWSGELNHLQPYPDGLLAGLEAASPGPEARYELRESVELAFVAAVQLLPPRQRAVLLLRDVLGWSAAETADALETSVAGVNSALQRARASLERARELGTSPHEPPRTDREADLLRRFVAAWEAVDIDGLVRLLAEDALMTMPPVPTYVRGADAIGRFFASVPAEGRLDEIRLVPTRANAQPALAAYVRDPADDVYRAYGVMVFALGAGRIAGIVGFADPALFEVFGLQSELD
jgi:RNA polymerase sigma-70 factor (ECF subfamily)